MADKKIILRGNDAELTVTPEFLNADGDTVDVDLTAASSITCRLLRGLLRHPVSVTHSLVDGKLKFTLPDTLEASTYAFECIAVVDDLTYRCFVSPLVEITDEDTSDADVEVAAPTVSVDDDGNVTLSSAGSSAIYYTIDGSVPTSSNGSLYAGTFQLAKSCTLMSVAVKIVDGRRYYSDVVKKEVTINTEPKYYIGAGSYDDYLSWDVSGWYANNKSMTGSVDSPLTTIATSEGIGIKCPVGHTIEISVYDSTGAEYVQELVKQGSDEEYDYYMLDGVEDAGFKVTAITYLTND